MLAPLSWLAEFAEIPSDISAESLSQAFVQVGFEVESVKEMGRDLQGPIVIGEVKEIEELTGHKKPIRYVLLDCGEEVKRGVICGARNFAVGDLVVVAKPGSILPGDFKIASRMTYDRLSDGMICSLRELGLGDDHTGIIVIPPKSAQVGDDARTVLGLDDIIFDISVNPDRGYALSMRGLARELASSLRVGFKDPVDRLRNLQLPENVQGKKTIVNLQTGASVIHVRSLTNVDAKAKTPLEMRLRLEKSGMRSISAAVDVTNYVMLELGQPLHAFDQEKIDGSLTVRSARSKEKLKTLDGVERVLTEGNLVIADETKVLALAGTMGGESSEVSDSTTEIALEAAHFDPISIAKNSRGHRLSTEASRRFERYVDSELAELASRRGVELLIEITGAIYIGGVSAGAMPALPKSEVSVESVNSLIGLQYSEEEVKLALSLIGCEVEGRKGLLQVAPPSWRPDLQRLADFAEEVARIHSYDRIPSSLPFARASSTPSKVLTTRQRRRRAVTAFLAAKGLSETQNYPFTSDDFIRSLGFTGERARSFKLANPLSDEFPVLRTHVLQSLLPTAVRNLNRGNNDVAIFEIGAIFRAGSEVPKTDLLPTGQRPDSNDVNRLLENVPKQPLMVAGVIAGEMEKTGWWGNGRRAEWVDAVSLAVEIVELCGASGEVKRSDLAPWHPGRCAEIRSRDRAVAHAGELHPRVTELLGLPARSVAFAVLLDAIEEGAIVEPGSISTMPPAIQDVALVVDGNVSAEEVRRALMAGAGEYIEQIELFDRYDKISEGRVSLAFTMTFRAPDRTLTAEEVNQFRQDAVGLARERTGAELRS